MGIDPIFDREVWERVPFHFWSLVFFTFGCIVGSFLNVVIHRLPIGAHHGHGQTGNADIEEGG